MITLHADIQVLKAHCCETLVSDSLNAIDIKFVFSEEWGGMTKTAQFSQANEETGEIATYNVLLDEADEARLPNEIKAGVVTISVFGVSGNMRMTTAPLAMPVVQSGFIGDGETPIPPTPDLYTQIIGKIDDAVGETVEEMEKTIAAYLEENPPQAGATEEEAAAIKANTEAIANLKPETIGAAPASHSHAWGEVTGKPGTFPPAEHSHAWGDVTGKPSAFPPATHTHTAAEVGALPATYKPPVTSVNGQTGDVVIAAGGGGTADTVAWANVTGKPSTFPPATHTHSYNDLTDKPTVTNGYTPQKGVDYWTAADKAEMVDDVLAALPTWNGGDY